MAPSQKKTSSNQSTRILAWNANGLLARKSELSNLLRMEDIDIALISETHLTSRLKADIQGYALYPCHHPSGSSHGGSAVYIRKNLRHHEFRAYSTPKIQAAVVTVRLHNGTDAQVASIYCPPRHQITTEEYKTFFNHLGNKWIAGGDFNAKHPLWGSRISTPKGCHLYEAVTQNGILCHSNGKPTYWPTDPAKKPDCIDFFVTKGISSSYVDLRNLSDLSSDHSPLLLVLSNTILVKRASQSLTSKRTDWDQFREIVNGKINLRIKLKTAEDVDSAILTLQTVLTDAAKAATPPQIPTPVVRSYPQEVREMVKKRRAARHRWQQTRDPADKATFNSISKRTSELIAKINNKSFEDLVYSLDATANTNYSLWRVAKATGKPPSYVPPLKIALNKFAHSDDEKATAFAAHLEKVFKPNDIYSDVIPTVQSTNGPPLKPVTPTEIAKVVKKLKTRKAPGLDLITSNILAQCPKKVFVLLTYVYNAIFRLRYFPDEWKIAKIILIQKPGKPADEPNSYRPISLLGTLSKVLEKLIYSRLLPVVEELGILPLHQFGFRSKHSTVEQAHRVTGKIRNSLEAKKFCPAIFIDVQQAFDRVWIPGLIHKVSEYLPSPVTGLLQSYLTNRKFEVHYGESVSNRKPITAGVPQGSILGPLLYVLYTADIPTTDNTDLATFADDTAILASHSKHDVAMARLQEAVDKIANWTKRWRIKINAAKSVHVMFTLRCCPPTTVILNDVHIPATSNARYLGLNIDSRLNWRVHISKKRDELKLRFRSLFWLLRARNKLSLANKRLLYASILRPGWSYAAPIWGCASKSNILVLQRQQNIILRKITGAPWYLTNESLHQDLNIPTVREVIRKLSNSYETRIHKHVNPLAIRLLEEPPIRRLARRHFLDLFGSI